MIGEKKIKYVFTTWIFDFFYESS